MLYHAFMAFLAARRYADLTALHGPRTMHLTINGERKDFPDPLTVAGLLTCLGLDRRKVAVEVNEAVVPALRHGEHRLAQGDRVEVVTLVGGGQPAPPP